MSTKTSIKRIAAVAAVALTLGGFTAVSASAVSGAYTATAARTNTTNTGASTAPVPAGTAITANLTLTTAGASANGETVGVNYAVTDPNGANITSTCTFTSTSDNVGANNTVTNTVGSYVIAATGANAGGLTAAVIGTVSCPTSAGGTYTITPTEATTPTKSGFATGTLTAVTWTVSGVNVSQGTTRGNPGKAATSNQAQVTVTFPTHTGSEVYKITSSGVGSIIGGTPTTGSTANISGVSTDFSQGLIYTNAASTALASELLTLSSTAAGVQTISVASVSATTGVATALYSTTVTWSAITTFSPTASLVRIAGPGAVAGDQGATTATTLTYTTALDAVPYTAVKTAGTNVATIEAVLFNADGSAATQGNKVTATISGSGLITVDTTATAVTGANRAQSVTLTAGSQNVAFIHVSADGTAGTGTITVTATDTAGVTSTLATKTVTFYGSVATLTAAVNYSVGKAGATTGAAVSALGANSLLNPLAATTQVPAFVITAKDSNGNAVTTASVPSVSSSDTTVVTGGSCALDNGLDATYSNSTNGVGVYNCSFTTAPNAVSGAKATLTVKVADPADTTGTKFITTTIPVSVGGKVATTTLTTNASSYTPGNQMVVTFTAKDSAGNPVYDGAASPGAVSANLATTGTAGFNGWYTAGIDASASSLAKSKFYAPSIAGDLVLSATGTDAALTPLTASAVVTGGAIDTAANAATDAANEATDAANAATDAALAAADAADAATAAAQDASDAVAALSATVAKLVASLKAQITSLTNLVIKIQKKVRA